MKDIHTLQTHYYYYGNEEGDGYEVYFDAYPDIKGFGDNYDDAYADAVDNLMNYLNTSKEHTMGNELMAQALKAYDEQSYAKAFDIWQDLAKENADAMVNLGTLYVKGLGVAKNMAKAAELFDSAVKKGHELAAYYLGGMHENGAGVAKNFERAHGYYEMAAGMGNVSAQLKLGLLLQHSDVNAAMYWLIQAAHNNEPQAQSLITFVSNAPLATTLNTTFRAMDETSQRNMVDSVIKSRIAPALAKDEGGIEFVNYVPGEAPQIWLRYLGACSGCHLGSTSTADMIVNILEEAIDKKIVLYIW